MENNNIVEFTIYCRPPGEDFIIEISFSENLDSEWRDFEISILINEKLIYNRDHDIHNDLIIKDNEEFEKYSYSIEEILDLINLRRYVYE